MVFVSHDRYFIDKLATRVFEIGDGAVHIFPGNYEDYLWRKENGAATPTPMPTSNVTDGHTPNSSSTNGVGTSEAPAESAAQKRMNPIKRQQMEERREELEEEIERLEAAVADCENQLLTFVSATETARLTQQLEVSRAELQNALGEWETLSTALS